MSKKTKICVVLVFFALLMNVTLSAMEYPNEMLEVSAPYPGATITQTVKVPNNIMVGMESNDNLDQIFEFYKTELPANGWTIKSEIKQTDGSFFAGEKGSKTVNVSIVKGGQSSKATIMISFVY